MIVVFGLGNPGATYEHTRHNVGFDAVNKAAAFLHVKLRKCCFRLYREAKVMGSGSDHVPEKVSLVEPLTYMNNSGNVVKYFDNKNATYVVVCDNMDLAVGGLRIKKGGGASGQRGLNSIASNLGRTDFIRIYIGIGRPSQGVEVIDHVLQREPDGPKKEALDKAIEDAAMAIVKFINGVAVEELQLEYNRKGLL